MALIRVLVLLQLLQQGAGAWGAAPAIEATGNDVVVSTPSDGKILFRIGDADAIDLKKLVDKVADLELRLQVATDNIALNSQRQTKGEAALKASDVRGSRVEKQAEATETDLSVVEAQVVKIQKIVSNMSECDQQGLHHGDGGVCTRSDAWSCPKLSIPNGAPSIKQEAFIGTVARVTCDAGSFLDGSETLTCLGSDSASTGAHWGLPSNGNAHTPKCTKCMSICKTCSDGASCDVCSKVSDVWSAKAGKCVIDRARSCKELLDWKKIPTSPPAGQPFLERTVELYPDVAGPPVKATCHIVKEDDGSIKAYTSIPCDTFSGGCKPFAYTTDKNTCTENGYIAGPPRSATHLDLIQRFGTKYLPVLIGVSRDSSYKEGSNGYNGHYHNCIFASPPKGADTSLYCGDWKAVDGGAWFARGTTHIAGGTADPNGDYCANTMLQISARKSLATGSCIDPSNTDACAREQVRVKAITDEWVAQRLANGLVTPKYNRDNFEAFRDKCNVACPGLLLYDNGGWPKTGETGKCPGVIKPMAAETYLCSTKDY